MSLKIIQPMKLFSERLILRSYQKKDEDVLFSSYFGNQNASKYLQRLAHQHQAQTERSLKLWAQEKWQNSDPEFMWVIAHRATQIPIGILIFMQNKDFGEIHFGLATNAQKQGFMQEAISTALCFLKQHKQLQTIETFSAADNLGSRHVLEKAGFQAIQYLPQHAFFPNWQNELQDCIKYRFDLSP